MATFQPCETKRSVMARPIPDADRRWGISKKWTRGRGERKRCNVPPPVIIATDEAEGAIVMDEFGGCQSRWVGKEVEKAGKRPFYMKQ
jgi:hypothetical protein